MGSQGARRAVVVGAGFGGLACAIDLARGGWRVTLFEKAPAVGGKARAVDVDGSAIDVGPTVLTMAEVFRELFASAGRRLEDYVALEAAVVLARHAWPDGARLDLFADREQSAAAVAAAFGRDEADRFRRFTRYAAGICEVAEGPFVRSQRPGILDLVRGAGALGWSSLRAIDARRSMAEALEEHFRTPHLRQLFGRYATYCGSSPFEAPATFNLVSHVEARGVHRVRGGIRRLAVAMETLARELGVEVVLGAEVEEIARRRGRAVGVRLRGGVTAEADVVVANVDVGALAGGLFGPEASRAVRPLDADARSLSAVTWAVAGRARGFPLLHHNVLFSDDARGEFATLRRARRVPDHPTVYVCAQDRGDLTLDEGGGDERLLLLVNAPPTGDDPARWTEPENERCDRATQLMMARFGVEVAPRRVVRTTPRDFARLFPGTGGALYGPAARGALSAFAREGARSKMPGLYLAGGSVHPGPGVPMAALSGRLAAARIASDHSSTRRSPTAGIAGSTSTA